jgi:uncharacterized protein
MNARQPNPRKLDVAAVAADGLLLQGDWPLAGLMRVADGRPQDGDVQWSVRGESRAGLGREPEIWLHLTAHARVWRECQRCLEPVPLDLHLQRSLRFVADEATAEALDADSEDDVLALPRSLDLRDLVEEELLLSLPIVPMHESCPQHLPTSTLDMAQQAEPAVAKNPFAVLGGLKREPGGGRLV